MPCSGFMFMFLRFDVGIGGKGKGRKRKRRAGKRDKEGWKGREMELGWAGLGSLGGGGSYS